MEALRAAAQDAAAKQPPGRRAAAALQLLAAAGPAAAGLVHARMQPGGGTHPLAGDELSLVAESIKLLLVGAGLAAASSAGAAGGEAAAGAPPAAQVGVMRVLVPLLVEAAAPAAGVPVTPLLRDISVKLVTVMPSSASGAAFREVVAALPAGSKQRLQVALREAAAGGGGSSAGTAAPAGMAGGLQPPKKPGIMLKTTFALPS